MNNGRDESFPINGNFSKSDFMILESRCKDVEKKLNNTYGPKEGEIINYRWNPIRVYISGHTKSSDNIIFDVSVAVHSSYRVAMEAKEYLAALGYDAGKIRN
ncbi:hypothetical protein [Proteus cibi]|uniref:hypothetical protein n=1 Tax=Proteus cibi TaxID=2050966 RepID=UPI000D687F5B|nr:hypothetical protein [Proteus cibi]